MASVLGYISAVSPFSNLSTAIVALVSARDNVRQTQANYSWQAVLYFPIYAIYSIFLHPLRNYPGPKFHAVSNVPYILWQVSGRYYSKVKRAHDKYGAVVRISPNMLSYISPQAWNDIYGHRKSNEPEMAKDPKWYVPDPNGDHILWSNREKHSHYRRLFSHGFSDRSLREQEPLIHGYIDMLIDGLTRFSDNGKAPLDIVHWFNWTTFDIIGDLTFGEPFGCLKNTYLHPWVRDMFQTIRGVVITRVLRQISCLGRYAPNLIRHLPFRGLRKLDQHLNFTKDKVTRRVNHTSPRPDFMEGVLRQPEGKGLTFPELLSNSSIFIIAGSETTATLLSGATYLLLRNKDKMEKLLDELRSTFHDESMITIESTSRLKYLPAVIEESLRLYSPVAVGFPRVVPKGGGMIDSQYVPGGVCSLPRFIGILTTELT